MAGSFWHPRGRNRRRYFAGWRCRWAMDSFPGGGSAQRETRHDLWVRRPKRIPTCRPRRGPDLCGHEAKETFGEWTDLLQMRMDPLSWEGNGGRCSPDDGAGKSRHGGRKGHGRAGLGKIRYPKKSFVKGKHELRGIVSTVKSNQRYLKFSLSPSPLPRNRWRGMG